MAKVDATKTMNLSSVDLKNEEFPSVSVVTAAYNSASILPRVLESIRQQDYPNIEIILVDGRSNDETIDVARAFGCQIVDNPLRYAEIGKYIGTLHSSGKYVAYIDSDNELPTHDWLMRMVTPLLGNPDLGGSFCLYHDSMASWCDQFSTNTYYSLLGNDPLSWFLGGISHTKRQGYHVFRFSPTSHPLDLALANGTLVRKTLVSSFEWDDDIYPLQVLDGKGLGFACVYDAYIRHHHIQSFGSFIKKYIIRARFRNQYRQNITSTRLQARKLRLLEWILYSLTIILPCIDVTKLYRRNPNKAWLIHPLACFTETMIYSLNNRVRPFETKNGVQIMRPNIVSP